MGIGLRDRPRRHPYQIPGKGHRHDPDQHDQQRQNSGRGPHAETGVMRPGGVIAALAAQEHMRDVAERIGHREERAERRERAHRPGRSDPVSLGHLGQHHLLGQVAVERRNARHRQRRDGGDGEGDGHQVPQSAQPLDVAAMRLVVDNARGHEERRLECRVVDDVEDRHHRRRPGAKAQKHGDEAQMTDRREGQERLEIVLEKRDLGGHHHGDQAGRGHDPEPFRRARQHRPHPRHQEQPRLHHRRRMQIGRDRRRRGHRVRQPEMERELRRFGETAQEDQDERGQIHRARLDRLLLRQDHAQVMASGDLAQDQHPRDHRQPAKPGDGQRHARALPPLGQVLPVADQQEGRERGQLPEDEQQQDVVRKHDPHHRPLEEQQIGIELPHRILARQVEPRVEDDQQTDAKDQPGKEQPQPVEHEIDVQAERGQPVKAKGQHLAAHHRGCTDQQERDRKDRRRGGEGGAGVAPRLDHQTRQERAQKRQRRDDRQEPCDGLHLGLPLPRCSRGPRAAALCGSGR